MTKTLLIGYGDLARRLRPLLGGEVTAIRRHPEAQDRALAVDASHLPAMQQLLAQGFDQCVITLTPTSRDDEGYRQGYVVPVQVLLRALENQPKKPRILFVSSTAVYGQQAGEWVDEDSPTLPLRYNGRRLLEAESLLSESGLPVVIARLSGIYGPGRAGLLERLQAGIAPGRNLQAWSNRIHADDAARALHHLLQLSQPESVYLLSDSAPAPLVEVVNGLSTALGLAARPEPVATELAGRRVSNRRLLRSGFELRYPDWRAGLGERLAGLKAP